MQWKNYIWHLSKFLLFCFTHLDWSWCLCCCMRWSCIFFFLNYLVLHCCMRWLWNLIVVIIQDGSFIKVMHESYIEDDIVIPRILALLSITRMVLCNATWSIQNFNKEILDVWNLMSWLIFIGDPICIEFIFFMLCLDGGEWGGSRGKGRGGV